MKIDKFGMMNGGVNLNSVFCILTTAVWFEKEIIIDIVCVCVL